MDIEPLLQQTQNQPPQDFPSPPSPSHSFPNSGITVSAIQGFQQPVSSRQPTASVDTPGLFTTTTAPIANPSLGTPQHQDCLLVEFGTLTRRTSRRPASARRRAVPPPDDARRQVAVAPDPTVQHPLTAQETIPQESYAPIGKCVPGDRYKWHCMWGSRETDFSVSTERVPCSERFDKTQGLRAHFAIRHAHLREGDHLWKCTGCGFYWNDPCALCAQCQRYSWQTWYWAKVCVSVAPAPAPTHQPVAPVAAGDGSALTHPAWVANPSAPMFDASGGPNGPLMISDASGGYNDDHFVMTDAAGGCIDPSLLWCGGGGCGNALSSAGPSLPHQGLSSGCRVRKSSQQLRLD